MTNQEMVWLENVGKVGACDTCIFRRPINEMNAELLPCNQYQCLVKLARLVKGEPAQTNAESGKGVEEEDDNCVRNANEFKIMPRQKLPVKIMNSLMPEEKIKAAYVGKVFGTYKVLKFAGYELNEISEGCKNEGAEYVNFIFKCKCKRCGSVRYVTHGGLARARSKQGMHCRNCCRISDDDERLIEWDEEET